MRGRKQSILDAALRAFSEKGFAAATVADVRALSGASTGSIYHHFGDKEGLASALYVEALRDYQSGLLAVLRRERSAERGVKAMVRHHLRWVEANPDLARFLLAWGPAGGVEQVEELNRDTFTTLEEWVRSQGVRRMPRELLYAVLFGPAQEFCRHWLGGRMDTSIRTAERTLAEAAWRALRVENGRPTRAAHAASPAPRRRRGRTRPASRRDGSGGS